MVPPMITPTGMMGAAGNTNAMEIFQQFYQLLLMQSMAAGNLQINPSMMTAGMSPSVKQEPTSPASSSPTMSPNRSPATSPAASMTSPSAAALTNNNMDALITELFTSAQTLKSQISPSVQQFKMENGFGPSPSPRQYKVHVNRESAKPLQDWMTAHLSDPYPTQKDVQQLAQETGFTHKQIRNWFTNSRRRFEQHCGSQNLPWQKKDAPRVCHRSSPSTAATETSSDMNAAPSDKPEEKEEAQSDEKREEEAPVSPSSQTSEMIVKLEPADESNEEEEDKEGSPVNQ